MTSDILTSLCPALPTYLNRRNPPSNLSAEPYFDSEFVRVQCRYEESECDGSTTSIDKVENAVDDDESGAEKVVPVQPNSYERLAEAPMFEQYESGVKIEGRRFAHNPGLDSLMCPIAEEGEDDPNFKTYIPTLNTTLFTNDNSCTSNMSTNKDTSQPKQTLSLKKSSIQPPIPPPTRAPPTRPLPTTPPPTTPPPTPPPPHYKRHMQSKQPSFSHREASKSKDKDQCK